jgi:hypothetical protein
MQSPPPFRQAPPPKEQLLSPERARAQNEALARQVGRAEMALIQARQQHQNQVQPQPVTWGHHGESVPWRYVVPVLICVLAVFLLPKVGVTMGRAALIGGLSALALFAVALVQDVRRWLHK